MPMLFHESPKYLLTSESVTEGHPDKLCDQISDGVLDAVLRDDPMGRVACETAVTNGLVVVMGEITTSSYVDVPKIVRDTLTKAGYTNADYGIDAKSCGVIVSIQEQSGDISKGVTTALEQRGGAAEEAMLATGAGDQGMMVGFACNETPELMPAPIMYAHKLGRQLTKLRKAGKAKWLRPDAKSQVSVQYINDKPVKITNVVISTQHAADASNKTIRDFITRQVIQKVLPKKMLARDTQILINPTGRFVIGGPVGDTGLTGRKIIVDTYGGYARHGGGAFSGKDPTKVDRSAAYAARYVAKCLVAAGLAERAEVQLSYAIGVAKPVSILVESFGTSQLANDALTSLVQEHFDLRPGAIIETFGLRNLPQQRGGRFYQDTAAYGHFGRELPDFTWEKTGVLR